MLGAIIGDVVGSVYEFDNIKHTNFEPFFHPHAIFTDDTVMSVAVADWLLHTNRSPESLEDKLVSWAQRYPNPMGGYGGGFRTWLFQPSLLLDYQGNPFKDGKRHPYYSYGNGSAMRASACGWVAHMVGEALDLGQRSAEVTHNHPEGIKGAQATAAAIFMARHQASKAEIRRYVESEFGYNLSRTCNQLRPTYHWDSSCQGTVPQAITAWLDSSSLEEAIRLAVSLGGDSDTLACITGGIAEAYATAHSNPSASDYYEGITRPMWNHLSTLLPQEMWDVVLEIRDQPFLSV